MIYKPLEIPSEARAADLAVAFRAKTENVPQISSYTDATKAAEEAKKAAEEAAKKGKKVGGHVNNNFYQTIINDISVEVKLRKM